ncbi:MAG: hypothetical protein AB7F09_04030 [Parvibaculaceae bacterium]
MSLAHFLMSCLRVLARALLCALMAVHAGRRLPPRVTPRLAKAALVKGLNEDDGTTEFADVMDHGQASKTFGPSRPRRRIAAVLMAGSAAPAYGRVSSMRRPACRQVK